MNRHYAARTAGETGPATVAFGLGSNVGDRLANLRHAVGALAAEPGLSLERISDVYETAPWGGVPQEWYLNLAVMGVTTLGPFALLAVLKCVERDLGRTPGVRWGPRLIDVDVLLYDDLWLRGPTLNVPHLHLEERAFVLAPLADVEPGLALPSGASIADRLVALTTEQAVRRCGHDTSRWLQSP